MPQIVVDGVTYAPSSPKFGVAITTRNRPHMLAQCVDNFRKHTPNDVPIIVVDDASTPPADADFRFDSNVGIATAKNKCLELLLKAGVEHLFVVDDDAWPIADNWFQPYIDSPEPHLFAVFPTPTRKSSAIQMLYRDDRHIAYHATRGYFLYFHRSVIDRVGGFDTRFRNAFEHVELSNRIHNAGLTSWPYQDITGSENLIFSADSQNSNVSAIPDQERRLNEQRGRELLTECQDRADFVPFGTRDIVLTCLFSTQSDPQRNKTLPADPKLADTLTASLKCDYTVLCDFPTTEPHFEQVAVNLNPYIQRWISYREHLVRHPEIRWVWCVDATDVECLNDPFDGMKPGVLYCGWENQILGCPWMLTNHQASQEWIQQHPDLTLLNAGVVGADRTTMLKFTRRIITLWSQSTVKNVSDMAGDMAYFNRAAYTMNVETGPRITTLFKANQRNDFSKWRHK